MCDHMERGQWVPNEEASWLRNRWGMHCQRPLRSWETPPWNQTRFFRFQKCLGWSWHTNDATRRIDRSTYEQTIPLKQASKQAVVSYVKSYVKGNVRNLRVRILPLKQTWSAWPPCRQWILLHSLANLQTGGNWVTWSYYDDVLMYSILACFLLLAGLDMVIPRKESDPQYMCKSHTNC